MLFVGRSHVAKTWPPEDIDLVTWYLQDDVFLSVKTFS